VFAWTQALRLQPILRAEKRPSRNAGDGGQ
jgi:hypothetical protein